MDANLARSVARRSHAGQFNRFGEPMIDHVERVALAVPVDARGLAYLHDVLERGGTVAHGLRGQGLTDTEYAVLELLVHQPGESYEAYVLRIARARGRNGRLARIIKLADLDDHLRHSQIPPRAPDYAWARRRIEGANNHDGERFTATQKRGGSLQAKR